jgi:ATP-dependent DNA helicase RecG
MIGEFLKELDLTEGRSTGIPKILKVMQENDSPPPEFETDEDRTSFLIRLPVHERAVQGLAEEITPQVTEEAGTKFGLSRDQVLILQNLAQDRSIAELMALLERSNRTKFRDQVLNPLLDADLAEMTIPDKPRSSKQRYRITDAGRALVEQHG